MPYRILCNGTEQKSSEARPSLSLAPSHSPPLHKFGMASPYSLIPFHEIILADLDTFTEHEEEIVDIEDFPGIAQVRRLLLQPSE
jgi:hypothetical protein